MAQEIYHRSEWGNPNEQWGNVYLNADLTNELYKRASEYENSWVTDQLLNGVGTKPSIILTPTAYENGKLNSVKPAKTFGSELVTNGTFDTDSDWDKQSGWSISGGRANRSGVSSNSFVGQDFNIEQGKKYIVKYDRTYISGNGETNLFSYFNTNSSRTTRGIYNSTVQETVTVTDTFKPTFSGNLSFRAYGIGDFTGSIDNITLKEVTEADFDFTRGSSATRVNEKGLIQDVQILSDELVQNGNFEEIGSELVTNGDFDTDSNWSKSGSVEISNGSANFDIVDGVFTRISQTISLTNGKTYKLTLQVLGDNSAKQIYVRDTSTGDSGNLQEFITLAEGTTNYTFYFTANSNSNAIYVKRQSSGDYEFSIDNVSVKEVGQNWTFGTGWSMEDGVVSANAPTGNLDQSLTATSGSKYRVTFTISNYVSGDIRWRFTGTSNENGTFKC